MAGSSPTVRRRLEILDTRIAAHVDPDYRRSIETFVPTGATILGVRVPKLRALARELWLEWEKPSLEELIALMDALCQKPHRERFLVGVFLLSRVRGFAGHPELWEAIDGWIEACVDWESVDQLAGAIAGEFLVGAPPTRVARLLQWTRSKNFWRRRFALICTIPPNHKGRSHPELALEIARPLLGDPEPMVSKAVGFALREACRAGGGELVFAFLMTHREGIHPRTLTESLKKLPASQQSALRR